MSTATPLRRPSKTRGKIDAGDPWHHPVKQYQINGLALQQLASLMRIAGIRDSKILLLQRHPHHLSYGGFIIDD